MGDIALDHVYDHLEVRVSPNFSSAFESFGLETLNLVLLSASYFVYLFVFAVVFALSHLMTMVFLRYRHYRFARQLGIWTFIPNKMEKLKQATERLNLESITDICIMSQLHFINWSNIFGYVDDMLL